MIGTRRAWLVAVAGVAVAFALFFDGSGLYDPHGVPFAIRLGVSAVVAAVALYGAIAVTWSNRRNRTDL